VKIPSVLSLLGGVGFTLFVFLVECFSALIYNNLLDNAIRYLTIGRKNFLFCGNHNVAGRRLTITEHKHTFQPAMYLQYFFFFLSA